MRRIAVTVAIIIVCLVLTAFPACAGTGWWTGNLPIDGFGKRAFFSSDLDWQSNFFTWDGAGYKDGMDYWRDQIVNNSSEGQDPQISSGGEFRGEIYWGKFSIGYITGMMGSVILSDSAVDFYRHLSDHTGLPGETYNIGGRGITMTYRGLSLGYTSAEPESRLRWGIRCNLLQGLSFNEKEYLGFATFNSPGRADAYIFQTTLQESPTHPGRGYSLDIYARYEMTSDWSLAFAWESLGRIQWSEAVCYERTIDYETEVDVNGNIISPVIYGRQNYVDHNVALDDDIRIGISKQYGRGDLTLGLEYRGEGFSWGAGWRLKLSGENRLLFNYDHRQGSFGFGWENRSLSILLQTNSIRWSDAATIGFGMIWNIF